MKRTHRHRASLPLAAGVGALMVAALTSPAHATTTLNFEEFAGDGNVAVNTQYAADGVTFANTYAFSNGNPTYPPHDGITAITDGFYARNITAIFSVAVQEVSGWYTAPYGMTLEAFDSTGAEITSETLADIKDANAYFSLTTGTDISKIVFVDTAPGTSPGYESVDDFTFGTAAAASAAPEPATWMMMILGFGLAGGVMRRAYRKSEEDFTRKVRSLATA